MQVTNLTEEQIKQIVKAFRRAVKSGKREADEVSYFIKHTYQVYDPQNLQQIVDLVKAAMK